MYKTQYQVNFGEKTRKEVIESLRQESLMFSQEKHRVYFHLPNDIYLKLYGANDASENFLILTSLRKKFPKKLEKQLKGLGFFQTP